MIEQDIFDQINAGRKFGIRLGDTERASIPSCPYRGQPLTTITGRVAGCNCPGAKIEVYHCRHFNEPVIKQGRPPCLDTLREKVPGATGRTCQKCMVPMETKTVTKPLVKPIDFGRFDPAKHLESFPYHFVSQRIAAVSCYFNPHNSEARRRCFWMFSQQFPRIGMNLFTSEGSLDDRWEIPESHHAHRWQLDPEACLFAKENLLNLAIARLPDHYDRVLWIDADVLMLSHDYVDRLAESLDAHPVVQAFQELRYLGPDGGSETGWRSSLGYSNAKEKTHSANHHKGGSYPGLAWAARRDILANVGGLYDRVITGGGDVAWATAVYGDKHVPYMRYWSKNLIADILRWGESVKPLVYSVGYVPARGVHLYHGKLASRQYVRRNEILEEVQFDPQRHLDYSPNGTLRWSSEAPASLRDSVREYMHGRKEDEQ
jgi:hypothetical protein